VFVNKHRFFVTSLNPFHFTIAQAHTRTIQTAVPNNKATRMRSCSFLNSAGFSPAACSLRQKVY